MMTYNRANNSISEAYKAIYNKSHKRCITESSETKSSLSDVEKAYAPLFNLMDQSPDMGRQVFATIVQQLNSSEQKSLCKQFGFEYSDAFNLIQQLTNYFYKGLNINPEKKHDFYTKIIPILKSEVIVNIIKHDYLIDIPVYKDSTATTTTINGEPPKSGEQPKSEEKKPEEKKTEEKKPEEKVKKVSIPADIDSDTINYYKGELDKIAKKSMRLRERILTIIRLQSEYIERFRNQNANQSAQYQQQAVGNGGYVTKGTVFLQGQQNPNTHQHVQPQQPQQPQQQPQNTPKQDEEEDGIFSKAMKGLGKAVGGVVGGGADIGSAALDAGKSGLGYLKRGADYLMGK